MSFPFVFEVNKWNVDVSCWASEYIFELTRWGKLFPSIFLMLISKPCAGMTVVLIYSSNTHWATPLSLSPTWVKKNPKKTQCSVMATATGMVPHCLLLFMCLLVWMQFVELRFHIAGLRPAILQCNFVHLNLLLKKKKKQFLALKTDRMLCRSHFTLNVISLVCDEFQHIQHATKCTIWWKTWDHGGFAL